MAQTIYHNPYGTIATALSTEFNSLANGSYTAASAAQGADATGGDLWDDLELKVTFSSAPSAGATVDVLLIPAADGSSYGDGGGAVAPAMGLFVGSFEPRAVTTAQVLELRDVPLPPGLFKYVCKNSAGVAFPASGSTLKRRPHKIQSV